MIKMTKWEEKALLFAEKYGIVEYDVIGDKMIYFERFLEGEWITYKATVDLKTMKETRVVVQ